MKYRHTIISSVLLSLSIAINLPVWAITTPSAVPTPLAQPKQPALIPAAPSIQATSYVLMDATTGKIIASKDPNMRVEPASLTKMMTMYIVSSALSRGDINLTDEVTISKKAWRTGGSRMFVRAGEQVKVEDLIHGVVIQSGNDACVALAEYVAGSEEAFASLMNQQAKLLGMKDTHFTDSTGMPHEDHYTTAHDLAILARALINDFPQYYHWYHLKAFKYNNIKQYNRNRLLWRTIPGVVIDGVKTGHTSTAGYCLVSSGVKDQTRLIGVVMGTHNDHVRTNASAELLSYGFRFFETHKLYAANEKLTEPRTWGGKYDTTALGLTKPLYITIATNQYKNLRATVELPKIIKAPINKGQSVGSIKITLNGKEVAQRPLVALQTNPPANLWGRFTDSVSLFFKKWFDSNNKKTQA
ncbi:MAG: D-alanyl-D-alanine carboxypeptidase family protein [Gammaproteobacteria bacterium]